MFDCKPPICKGIVPAKCGHLGHRQVLVFNIRRNDYRLIVAAHFNRQIVYTLRFVTHAEYSKNRWKETL